MSWPQARTVMFCTLGVAHLGYAFVVRRGSGGPGSNRLLLLATLGGGLVQVLLVVVPPARAMFDVVPLPPSGWVIVAVAGILPNIVLWAGTARASSTTG
jgi:magnesium-transporting ATPase (P-type)